MTNGLRCPAVSGFAPAFRLAGAPALVAVDLAATGVRALAWALAARPA